MASQRKLVFPGPAGSLEGMLHLPDGAPQAVAVIAHPLPIMGGTMDNKVVTTLTRTFVELGYATLRFNFRGVGESAGSYDEGRGETVDAIAAAQFMRDEFGELPLITAGFSFGGYVQARAALELKPQRMVLVAPAVGRFEMPPVPADTLLIHGDMDEVVALDDLLSWARPQHLSVVVLTGAEHYFHGRLTQLKQIVAQQLRGLA
ncbi:MAG TPA: alpha/beta fold hydrolase [Gallionella sp.]|nr:alpha/beta fold hydrolase [Gallionella sp.]